MVLFDLVLKIYLSGNILNFEFSFRWVKRRPRLKISIAKKTIDHSEAENVVGFRVPLDDDGSVLTISVFDDNLSFCRNRRSNTVQMVS